MVRVGTLKIMLARLLSIDDMFLCPGLIEANGRYDSCIHEIDRIHANTRTSRTQASPLLK